MLGVCKTPARGLSLELVPSEAGHREAKITSDRERFSSSPLGWARDPRGFIVRILMTRQFKEWGSPLAEWRRLVGQVGPV